MSPEDIDGRETSKENKKVILWKEKIIHQAMSEMSDLKKYNDVGLRGIRLDDPHVMQGIEKNISNYLDEMLSLGSKVLLNGGRDFTTDKIQTYIENIESA